jgi:nitrile hydratase
MSGDHASAPIAARVRHVEALLEQRGLVDPVELDRALTAFLAQGSPAVGAPVVARLRADANSALPEVGASMGGGLQEQRLKVVENTASVHNLLVCTLCSCYPIALLGPSPTWYKSEGYRARVVREPRAVLHEFGYDVPDDVRLCVWDASAESRYMVLPLRPVGTEERSEAELAAMVTRNGLIGVAPL